MAVIKPFRGVRYRSDAIVGGLSAAICPPYDMIDGPLKAQLQQRSPYNAVHLEGGEQPDPVDPAAGYQQAAARFRQWQTDGVLQRDDVPSFYLMRHSYDFDGHRRQHLGLFAAVLVEDYEAGAVLPHEFTREPAVLDRVALLEAGGAQFSPIMSLYHDAAGDLRRICAGVVAGPPDAAADTPAGGHASLWRITDAGLQADIAAAFAGRPVFLADGHHRYEAARRYRRRLPPAQQQDDAAAGNYVMMTLVEFDDPGLLLLPYHRVLGGMTPEQVDAVRRRIGDLFEARPLDAGVAASDAVALVAAAGADAGALCFAAFWGDDAPPALYTIRPGLDWASWDELAVSEAWVLQERILAPVLGDALPGHIDYSPDHEAIVRQARAGEQQAAILLKPFPLEPFRRIVGAGRRLPPKSTFFYPKLPTGLVINRLDGGI